MARLHLTAASTVKADHSTSKDGTCAAAAPIPKDADECGTKPTHIAGPLMTDAERESAITRAARAMEHHMAEVAAINARTPHVFSDFVDASASRWMADRARKLMEQLIAGRKGARG